MAISSPRLAMSWSSFSLTCALVSTVLALLPHVALTCSPIEGKVYTEAAMETKVAYSPVVVSGVAMRRRDSSTDPNLYNVDFEVQCVFKGVDIKQYISINDVGHIPGHCDGTNLNIGGSYLVYLDPHSLGNTHYFTMKYPEDSGEKQYLDDAVYMCGATSKLPKGVTKETAKFVCPSPNAEPTECIPPPTTATPPEPPTPKVKVGPPPAEADHKPGTSTSGNGASYESVVEDNSNNKNNNNNKDDGDKDAATSLLGSWLLSFSLIFCRLL